MPRPISKPGPQSTEDHHPLDGSRFPITNVPRPNSRRAAALSNDSKIQVDDVQVVVFALDDLCFALHGFKWYVFVKLFIAYLVKSFNDKWLTGRCDSLSGVWVKCPKARGCKHSSSPKELTREDSVLRCCSIQPKLATFWILLLGKRTWNVPLSMHCSFSAFHCLENPVHSLADPWAKSITSTYFSNNTFLLKDSLQISSVFWTHFIRQAVRHCKHRL